MDMDAVLFLMAKRSFYFLISNYIAGFLCVFNRFSTPWHRLRKAWSSRRHARNGQYTVSCFRMRIQVLHILNIK